jgi:hypothetical protein
MKLLNTTVLLKILIMLFLVSPLFSQESRNERQLNTIRYGTDTEIAALKKK